MGRGHAHGGADGGHAHDGHAHDGHAHGGRGANRKRLAITLALVSAYMVAEVVGGFLTNSLALLADAGHMLSDAGALALSLFAMWIAERPPTPKHSYGYYRTEILAALVNGATLVAISIFIFVEAWERFREPPEVQGALMMGIATGGLVVNLVGLWILNAGRGESLNMRGAWLHVLTDALGSVGAILGGFLIWSFGWAWADPAVSVLIGLLVIFSSWNLLKETVAVLMESAPAGIDVDAVRDTVAGVAGVTVVHDLHVWSITSGMVALSTHVCVAEGTDRDAALAAIRGRLHEAFGIDHSTIQIEREGFPEAPMHA
jgi:cobalt-zinc-cadmium efflux system protein